MTTANISSSQLFEAEIPLPDDHLMRRTRRLVGFQARYERLRRELRLLIDREGIIRLAGQIDHPSGGKAIGRRRTGGHQPDSRP
jgi:hypothetical protein